MPKPSRAGQRLIALVVAIATGGTTILGLYKNDKRAAVLGFVGMVFAAILTLAIQRAIAEFGKPDARFYDVIVKTMTAFVLLYFMGFMVAIFPWILRQMDPDPIYKIDGSWHDTNWPHGDVMKCSSHGTSVTCTIEGADFRHELSGTYKSGSSIGGTLKRIEIKGNCTMDKSPFDIILKSSDQLRLSWNATGGCGVPPGEMLTSMFMKDV